MAFWTPKLQEFWDANAKTMGSKDGITAAGNWWKQNGASLVPTETD